MKAPHFVIYFSYRVYCLLGDGEMSEGSVWEAMSFASYYQLENLVAILDVNRLGQSDPAPLQHHVEKFQKRCEAFGYSEQFSMRPVRVKINKMVEGFLLNVILTLINSYNLYYEEEFLFLF